MNSLTFSILHQLANGQFHSGEALAKQFNVSRATIWNAIQYAQSLGIEIFSVRGRGYKLPKAISLLDKTQILQAIGVEREWFHIEVLDEVVSTNTYLMKAATSGAPHASCVVAHIQTNGRGRRGRLWVSHLGASLTFSLLWRFDCGAAALSGLSLAIGVGLIRALNELGVISVQLKWPNDVLVGNKKLAGILIDLQGDLDGPSAAVIGVGININLPEHIKKSIDQPVIDLSQLGANHIDQNKLLGTVLKHFANVLKQFEQSRFVGIRDEWLSYHAYHLQPVRLLMPDGRYIDGEVTDVADDGILLVNTAYGVQRFSAGEISLRSIA
ncbi:MAG TPA: biotin--[acetyl-CoA-carboxylase] ligase [Methylophilaceae bacterium]|nr:biotin--[acetyl-CoA-carboxylase] ligase [Methylophilaceae bacterium]